jgi:hypothetical protein
MRKLGYAIVAAVLVVGGAAFAGSWGVTNEDNVDYSYDIVCGGSSSHGTFHHGHNAWSGSVNNCTLKVKGAGSAKIDNHSECSIKDHMLSCN